MIHMRACDDSESKTRRREQLFTLRRHRPLTVLVGRGRRTSVPVAHERRTKGIRTVDQLAAVVHDPLDLALLLQVPDSYPCQAPIDLQPLDEDALTDKAEGRDFLQNTVVGGLVKDHRMLGLVLDLSLRPLLLLRGLAAR